MAAKPTLVLILTLLITIALFSIQVSSSSSSNAHSETPTYESLRGFNYLINPDKKGRTRREVATCDRFPRVCHAKGSAGRPDCCGKKCVNIMTDSNNCGECGRKCRFGHTCCGGNCMDVMFDRKNCGACRNRCKKGSFCNYGMCSYA